MDSPCISIRCMLWPDRSRLLSAMVGSPIWACQVATGRLVPWSRCSALTRAISKAQYLRNDLLPVAFHQDITAIAADVAMRHPFLMPSRRFFPSSTLPLIGVTVPTVIPADPPVVAARRRRTLLHQNARRSEPNHYIGCGCAHCQQSREHQSQKSFLDHRLHPGTSRVFCLCQIALRVEMSLLHRTVRHSRGKQCGYVQNSSPHGIHSPASDNGVKPPVCTLRPSDFFGTQPRGSRYRHGSSTRALTASNSSGFPRSGCSLIRPYPATTAGVVAE